MTGECILSSKAKSEPKGKEKGGFMKRYCPTKGFPLTVFFFYAGIRWIMSSLFIVGVISELLFLIRFFTNAGVSSVMEAPFEDSKEYKLCVMGIGYNFREELERQKRERDEYLVKQQDAWKKILLGGFVFLIGFVLTFISMLLVEGLLWFFGGVFTVMIEFTGLKIMLDAYLDMDTKMGKEFAETFMISSIPIKLERSSKMITILLERIRKEEEKEKEKKIEKKIEKEKLEE